MSWFDQPKKWWVYRWTHHFWVLSFNRNSDLYRVVWWSRYTRPMFYNTRGRFRSPPILWFVSGWLFLIFGLATIRGIITWVLGGF